MIELRNEKMKKNSELTYRFSFMAALCVAALAACGGGLKEINYTTPTPVPTAPGGGGMNDEAPPAQEVDPAPEAGIIDFDCIPAAPSPGQIIKLQTNSVDGQGSGDGIYPVGSSTVMYTFAADGSFSVTSSNSSAYVPSPSAGTYSANGNVIDEVFPPFVPDPVDPILNSLSIITYSPSDWMQRATKQPALAVEGGTYTTRVVLEAKGKLPYILASLYGVAETDPENNAIQATFTATITRLPNAAVGSTLNACSYSVKLTRPSIAVNEDNALNSYKLFGAGLSPVYNGLEDRLFLEPYMPMLEGTFSTSNAVPFVPVRSELVHTYGVSSLALSQDVATNKCVDPMEPIASCVRNVAPAKALEPSDPAAQQTIIFESVQ